MQRTRRVKVQDLREGEILTTDIYIGAKKLITEGSVVTKRLISFLKNSNIELVEVKMRKVTNSFGIEKKHTINYVDILSLLNMEKRYGKVVYKVKDVENVMQLFDFLMENDLYRQKLHDLREHDYYTFLHSVDVFTLCTLFAKREYVLDFEQKALGFLFHDIGKLRSPKAILQKTTTLTKSEMEKIQMHTTDGQKILKQMGLYDVSYLAKSHHERLDGSGYPEAIEATQLSKEVRMLKIVDVYSALTLKRPYKEAVLPQEAIQTMYQHIQDFDEELLRTFTDFIGIYPEKAIVVLSNGAHAKIEKTNGENPMLPIVKQIDTSEIIQMPYDQSIYIHKMLSYSEECADQLFVKFSDMLIKGYVNQTKIHYEKLKETYQSYEWYTHILIPVFKIIQVMTKNHMLSETRQQTIANLLGELLVDTTVQLARTSENKETVLLIVDDEKISSLHVSLFEGMLQTEEVCPLIMKKTEEIDDVQTIVASCQIKQIFILGRSTSDYSSFRKLARTNCFTKVELEKLLGKMSYADLRQESFKMHLKTYI